MEGASIKMRKLRSRTVTTLALLGFFASVPLVCRADSITFSTTVPFTNAPFSDVSLSSIQQFDPAQGTLTGVLISAATHGVESGTLRNNATSPSPFISIAADTEILMDSTIGLVDSLIAGNDYGDLTAGQNYFGLAAGATANFGPINSIFAFESQTFSSGLTPFLGVGSLGLELGAVNTFTVTGGNTVTTNLMAQAGSVVTVTYTFTPSSTTPEPASLSFGLLGVAIFVGKRWSSSRNIRKA